MKQSIKIISGFSSTGGSTLYFINLTNLLNENGYDCIFYGPHEWHLDKCKSGYIGDPPKPRDPVAIYPTDIVISHFIDLNLGPVKAKKHILSCHETNMFELKTKDLSNYDLIQYVSQSQKEWQGVEKDSVIIPPIAETLRWEAPESNIAGVVGSIDSHKQTHLSVEAALRDGYDKVFLYGNVGEAKYFEGVIKPLLDHPKVYMMGPRGSKEEMYSTLDAVYHNSKRETYGLVEAECTLAGIPFVGPRNNPVIVSEAEHLAAWRKCLDE
tara:strand:- start:9166 stop:9969 length:804 start_codon:yes stop_codon:yes gene_type:complete